ncbi:MAG: undecaprenyldiphospho-muramoylpentapeptide beta-N-acetylglucosaminyltransferase [Candidatus Aminicenantales bacterium]
MSRQRSIFIAGGGTGGHLYPALAVGRKLREKMADIEIYFIGSQRPLEKEIIQQYGEKFISLPIEGLRGRGKRALRSWLLIVVAFIKSLSLCWRKQPALVIGVGGYSSGPVIVAAWFCGKPILILEQNARPGFTNRILRPVAKKAIVAFRSTLPYFGSKGVILGNPVRPEFRKVLARKNRTPFTILVFGGSQGSNFLNQLIIRTLPLLKPLKEKILFFHQTGPKEFDLVAKAYEEHNFSSRVVSPYFFDMPARFAAADLIICRAGATSVAELIASRRAAILIPFARAAENHQYWNARELASQAAADMLVENEASPETLAQKIQDYFNHPEKLTAMEERLAELEVSEPEEKIAALCLDLMKLTNGKVKVG